MSSNSGVLAISLLEIGERPHIKDGVRSVRNATAEFMAHYHRERNHQGLANALIRPEPEHVGGEGEVHRRERLGGLLNYYYRKAA